MRRIHIVGASHAVRLRQALTLHTDNKRKYTVVSHAVPSKKYFDLIWPDFTTLEVGDVLVLILFGNDLFKNGYRKYENVFHLEHFAPNTDEYFNIRYLDLKNRLSQVPAGVEVKIVSSFYRHFCCAKHTHVGLLKYFNFRNRQLEQFKSENVMVLDHRYLVHSSFRKAKDTKIYRALQADAVHFRSYAYIAERILSTISW